MKYILYRLVSRVEKNLSDHTEFLKAKSEIESWLQRAHGTVNDCIGSGDLPWAKDKLETIKLVATRMTEGEGLKYYFLHTSITFVEYVLSLRYL